MSSEPPYTISIRGWSDHLEDTCELIHFIVVQTGVEKSVADVVSTALGEACQNAIRYSTDSSYNLELQLNHETLTAIVMNDGEPVDFDGIQPFNVDQDYMQYKNGGLGLPMMKKLMDKVTYERTGSRNKFTLVKHLKRKENQDED